MSAGTYDSKASFYSKSSTRGDYGDSVDSWTTLAFETRGNIQYVGGSEILSNEERFYSGLIFFTMRYRQNVVETMRVLIGSDWYRITYIEHLGRNERLKLSLSKINE